MALRLPELKKLVDGEGLHCFVDEERGALLLPMHGPHGRYQIVLVLELEGTFLQIRTISLHHCPTGHKHLEPVLQALLRMNYELRLVKFGWDPRDGEIVAYADLWIMDAAVTKAQFSRMLHNYLPALDVCYGRIVKTLETGKDPGPQDAAAAAAEAIAEASGGSLPEPLRRLLEPLLKAAGEAPGKGDGETEAEKKKKEKSGKVTKI